MAEEEDEENKVPKVDLIVFLRDWFKTRVLSSLKCKEDLVKGLIDKEPSATAVDSFWKENEVQRLIVYFKDAELLAVRARTRPDIPRTIVARSPIFPLPFAPIQPKQRHKIDFTRGARLPIHLVRRAIANPPDPSHRPTANERDADREPAGPVQEEDAVLPEARARQAGPR